MAATLQVLRSRARRSSGPARRPHPASRASRAATAEVDRHRRAGGPEDVALYTCGCGYAFEAKVTASVGCPHCGSGQAW